MTELSLRRNTGIFGLVATLISLTQLPLYFMYTGPPPQWDILTRVMVSIIGSAIFIVFLTGFRLVIRQASREMEWAYYCTRLRADVADVQLRGPIDGSWNCDCV
jgi:hypothetical protein